MYNLKAAFEDDEWDKLANEGIIQRLGKTAVSFRYTKDKPVPRLEPIDK